MATPFLDEQLTVEEQAAQNAPIMLMIGLAASVIAAGTSLVMAYVL